MVRPIFSHFFFFCTVVTKNQIIIRQNQVPFGCESNGEKYPKKPIPSMRSANIAPLPPPHNNKSSTYIVFSPKLKGDAHSKIHLGFISQAPIAKTYSVLPTWLFPPPLENVQLNAGYANAYSPLFVVDWAAPRFFRLHTYEIGQCYYAEASVIDGLKKRRNKTEHTWASCLKTPKEGELPEMCGAGSVGQGWYLHN